MISRPSGLIFCLLGLLALPVSADPLDSAWQAMTAANLLKNVGILASDKFAGRGTAGVGEQITVDFLSEEYRKIGLAPGNPDGSYVQKVPLIGITTQPEASFLIGGKDIPAKFPGDFIAFTSQEKERIEIKDSGIVFVGYEVVAPEYDWDDYKGLDVKGKTLLMLVNDPAVVTADNQLDDSAFKGNAMTYYGRWTYKYEIASLKGAAACLIIHETIPAAYPYEVVVNSWTHENFEIQTPDKMAGTVPVKGWVTLDQAKRMLTAGGQDFDALKKAARQRDFQPVELPGTANFTLVSQLRPVQSQNVVGLLPGSDPKLKDEWIIYSAHWDHLGIDPKLKGDQIYNGALDNASGVASILEIARGFQALPKKPRRSILFLATTGEEKGLLGARYYAFNPLHPLNQTLADINLDGANVWGPTRDIMDISWGNSTLDDLLVTAAATQKRTVKPFDHPEKGSFYRADHFEFSKLGLPALYLGSGTDYLNQPAGFGEAKTQEYTAKHYHQVSDEVDPAWDLSGAIDDCQLLLRVGYAVSQGETWPEWKPGTEFKAVREKSLK